MDLTPYDPGLHVIQQAQEAHDAGDLARAKSLYLRGSEELMAVLQHDQEERRKSLVKKHVKNFMDKAEHIIDARRGAPPSRPPPPRPQSAPCPSSGSAAGGPALSDTARSLLASAQRSEKRARDAERELRFVAALPAFVEAAETFTALRAEVAGDSQLLSWAATRALAMIEGAERIKLLINNTSLGGDNSARSGAIITGADRNPIPAGGHRHGGGRKPQALAMQMRLRLDRSQSQPGRKARWKPHKRAGSSTERRSSFGTSSSRASRRCCSSRFSQRLPNGFAWRRRS